MYSVRVWGFRNETHHLQLVNRLSNPAFHSWASNSLTVFPNSKSEFFSAIKTAKKGPRLQPIHAAANEDGGRSRSSERNEVAGAKGSGTSARGRRLLKVREEKRRREYDRLHKYPSWAKLVTLFKWLSSMCLN